MNLKSYLKTVSGQIILMTLVSCSSLSLSGCDGSGGGIDVELWRVNAERAGLERNNPDDTRFHACSEEKIDGYFCLSSEDFEELIDAIGQCQ